MIEFFHEYVEPEEFYKKRVLEVGSKYVNGSVRPFIERFLNPREYIGIDIEPGKYVDILLPAEKIVEYFGEESFDVIVSTEVLEHVRDWRAVINNMKRALREGGIMYITTRSFGFPYHNFPQDFWRYEIEDMRKIFDDFNIIVLKRDSSAPGVFLKARKPEAFKPNDLSDIALYSIILGKKTRKIPSISEMPLRRKISLELTIKVSHLGRYLINKLSSKYMV
ncbi:MAG: class I SAM-dependent methyltransferase [Thermosphaera sp.]